MPIDQLDDRAALVVIDLQAGILAMQTKPNPPDEVLSRAAELARAFRERNLSVVLVRVTRAPDGADAPPGRVDFAPNIVRPEGWDQLSPQLGPAAGDTVVTKRNWSAFYGTDLDLQLRRRGVTQIVLAGIATSLGVESTARAAHERAYSVVLASDAMGDPSAEAHENSVTRIFPRLGQVTTTAELIGLLRTS